ncbi:MAG: hypothetical protein ACI87E_001550 [Mariniblastus sp.]|jgi:hypothetical protein
METKSPGWLDNFNDSAMSIRQRRYDKVMTGPFMLGTVIFIYFPRLRSFEIRQLTSPHPGPGRCFIKQRFGKPLDKQTTIEVGLHLKSQSAFTSKRKSI